MIFLGGVHGVGKTHLLEEIKNSHNISIYSASSLIAQKKDNDYIKDKFRTHITDDQDLLLQAISEFVNEEEYILDGHFCLLNVNGEIERIPHKIFLDLPIEKIFVLVGDVNEVIKRLYQRDGRNYKYGQVKQFQEAEIGYAKEIADLKKIDLELISNKDKLLKYLRDTIG